MIRILAAEIQGIEAGTGCRFNGRAYQFTHQITLFIGCFARDYSPRRMQNTNLLTCLDIGLNALVRRIKSPRGAKTRIPESLVYASSVYRHIEKASVRMTIATKHPSAYEENLYTWEICYGKNNILTGLHLLAEEYRKNVINENNSSLPLLIKYNGSSNFSLKMDDAWGLVGLEVSKSFSCSLLPIWLIKHQSMAHENWFNPDTTEFLRGEVSTELANTIIKKNDQRIDKHLEVVRETISKFIPYVKDIRVAGNELAATIYTDCSFTNKRFGLINEIPEKEVRLIALIGDICARLSLLNPESENPLLGEGIILIDQIDLIIPDYWVILEFCKFLGETFPNCQFILTNWGRELGEVNPIVNLGQQY